MYVRLAFAVAAHLEPDILIIDEVLAVGDAEFQKKCIGKMKDVSRGEGRTVLFVSHDMRAVKSLCQKALVLKNGIIEIGLQNVQDAINEYSKNKNIFMDYMFPLVLDNELVITDFRIEQFGIEKDEYESECPTKISIGFELLKDIKLFRFGIFIKSAQGELISASLLADWEPSLETLSKGKYVIEGSIAPNFLLGGVYRIEIHGSIHGVKNYCIENFIQRDIKVISPSNYNIQHITEPSFGYVISNFNWKLSK
jgi:lipopolysaccharide transport system ATP-binding protein